MDSETTYLCALLAILIASVAGCIIPPVARWIVHSLCERAWLSCRRVSNAQLNDCRPGCFMVVKGEDTE